MGHTPTTAQRKIFDFVKNGTGNGIIDAVAGAGKTSTLMGCVMHIPNVEDAVYCAFNTSIRKELQKKFHEAQKNVKVNTIHSLGFQMLRATRDYKLNDRKYKEIINDSKFFETLVPFVDKILGYHGHQTIAELKRLEENQGKISQNEINALNEGLQYVRLIKHRLLQIDQKYRCTLEDDDLGSYAKMVLHFGIFPSIEAEKPTFRDELMCYFNAHQRLLKEGISMAISHGIIDFTDQLYLPSALNLTSKIKYGFVFVDECQDLSKAQLYVVKQYLREDGRLLAVGDPYQAIYGFAGADCDSFERVKKTFNCTRLELTDCFRCPQNVIALAKSIRKDIKGFKQYPGEVYRIPKRDVTKNIQKGDLVICRTRTPLMEMALKLIAKDFKVKIHPDELQEFMEHYRQYFTPNELRTELYEDMIDDYFEKIYERNVTRIEKETKNPDSAIRHMIIDEEVYEMEEALFFFKEKFFSWQLNTLKSILTRLKHTLSYPGDDAIKISSIHRAKGLENDRVFILEYNKLPYPRNLNWECTQERNLHYVALTRPKEVLYLCEDQLRTDGDEGAIENENAETSVNEPFDEKNESPNETNSIIKVEIQSEANPSRVLSFNMSPTQRIARIPENFYALEVPEDCPYQNLNGRPFQKAKFWSVFSNLQDTEFSISNVISLQYRDDYYINTPNGIEIYNGNYNKGGQYTFRPQGNCINAEQVMCFLSDESNYKIRFEYAPQNDGFGALHEVIQAACQELNICNTNIIHQNYAIVYCFRTISSYAMIKFMYNGRKRITTVMPSSTLGGNDDKLNSLLEILQHLWQR